MVDLLTYRVTIPVWILGVTALAITVAFLAVRLLHRTQRGGAEGISEQEPAQELPDWRQYTSDIIDGVRWVWDWNAEGQIIDLIPFCRLCTNELIVGSSLEYICDRCGFTQWYGVSEYSYLQKVGREIRRRVVTGEYVQALKDVRRAKLPDAQA